MHIVQPPKFFFWALLAVLAGCGAPDAPPVASSPETTEAADKIFMNGKIITVDDNNPRASAVATRDGKIVYVGDLRGAQPLVGDATERVDLAGKTLVPGFVDAHGHVVTAGLQSLVTPSLTFASRQSVEKPARWADLSLDQSALATAAEDDSCVSTEPSYTPRRMSGEV